MLAACMLYGTTLSAQFRIMEELPNMHVNDISRDADSFMWISTDYGLSRFNGTDYTTYYHLNSDPSSLPSDKVICTACDSRGELWVLTKAGVSVFDPIANGFGTVLEYNGPKEYEAVMKKYQHPITKAGSLAQKAKEVGGHGGMDFIMDYRLVYCLNHGLPLDQDVYDAAEWSSLVELTEVSIRSGSKPVVMPDFTRGDWNKMDGLRLAE